MSTIANPLDLARQISSEYQACYGADLISVLVYGSAAGGDFDPKRSDINLLVVLTNMSLGLLEKSEPIQSKWMKRRVPRPLFMDPAYISSSLDSFPIEFLNMKGCYSVAFGRDLLVDISIRQNDLRVQIERELKGKWLHLTREWLATRNDSRRLSELLHASLRDFSAAFRALIHLRNGQVPRDRQALFAAVCEAYDISGNPFAAIREAYQGNDMKKMQVTFPAYAAAIEKLTKATDTHSTTEVL